MAESTPATEVSDIESVVRARLRGLRTSLGWSLDELAARTSISASTISRIETGKRSISLDMLQPLCRALQVDVASLLDDPDDDGDVVIRPSATDSHGMTSWMLSRAGGPAGVFAAKLRFEASDPGVVPELRVHPGRDWFFVLSGAVLLYLGDRRIKVAAGEAAEFSTMTPHAFAAVGGPAELITIFDSDGQRAHMAAPA